MTFRFHLFLRFWNLTLSQNSKSFCSIDSLSREAVVFSFSNEEIVNNESAFDIISYDIFPTSNRESSWTSGDFNSDGVPELVTASPDKGEVFHIESGRNGFSGKVKSYPSLKGISHLSSLRNKGKQNCLF